MGAKNAGYPDVSVGDGHLDIIESVCFTFTDHAEIEPRSFELLDKVVAALVSHNNLMILVEATDSQGNDAYNKKLSQRRAAAVVAYLIRQHADHRWQRGPARQRGCHPPDAPPTPQ